MFCNSCFSRLVKSLGCLFIAVTFVLLGSGRAIAAGSSLGLGGDILWDLGSSAPAVWNMNAGTVQGISRFGVTMPPGWKIAGVGDFNGDGLTDVLWTTAAPGGPAVLWLNKGGGIVSGVNLAAYGTVPGTAWIGNFAGDGTSDILWDMGSSAPVLWRMNGGTVSSIGYFGVNMPPGWQIAGVGDFNGDGLTDALWTTTKPGGPVFLWLNSGNGGVTGVSLSQYGGVPGKAWIGNFAGDGKSDILWDMGSSAPVLWRMNGNTVSSISYFGVDMPAGWKIAAVGDFNGDGLSDVLWTMSIPGNPPYLWLSNTAGGITGSLLKPFGGVPIRGFTGSFMGSVQTAAAATPALTSNTATVGALNGVCGAGATATASLPTTGLCTAGTATAVSGSGPWAWSCLGAGTGSAASCTASVLAPAINGVCGTAAAATTTQPMTNLCSMGTATTVTGNDPWSWSCAGRNGGTTAQCSTSVAVDPTTLNNKVLFGYQGWFSAFGDGDPFSQKYNSYEHWSNWGTGVPGPNNVVVDMWPDMTAYSAAEKYPTNFTLANGQPATVYSAYNPATVDRHFSWMQQYGLDGVVMQRFVRQSYTDAPELDAELDQVAQNIRQSAEKYGRVFAAELDCSAETQATVVSDVEGQWQYIVDTLKLTQSPAYLHHKGKPVVALYGFGVYAPGNATLSNVATPAQAAEIISWFHNGPAQYQATIIGQVPLGWRTLGQGTQTDPAWTGVFASFDVISPWSVGGWRDIAGADANWNGFFSGDIDYTKALGIGYMPVVWPGFSFSNTGRLLHESGEPVNVIPRLGGNFWWHQVYNLLHDPAHRVTMMYGAMFDEVSEGTAMYKIAPTANDVPNQAPAQFVYLDIDGYTLPSDWYLQLAGLGTQAVHGNFVPTLTMPITPPGSPP